MTTNPFAAPATTSGIDWKDLNGLLLYIEPKGSEKINTSFGESDVVRCDLVVLDGPNAGQRYDDALVFPKVFANQLRPKIGEKVLGRLGQGQAKSGQSAPWLLNEATPADVQIGINYLAQSAKPAATSAAQPPF
jgi:hypothetical protein